MRKLVFSLSLLAVSGALATATPVTVFCTPVASGANSSTNANFLVIAGGTGAGSFNCPSIPVQTGDIINFTLNGTGDFTGGQPPATATTVTWTDTLATALGSYGTGNVAELITGDTLNGSSSGTKNPGIPFILGNGSTGQTQGTSAADLGVTSLSSFTVNVGSSATAAVGASSGVLYITYDVQPPVTGTPEPATLGLMGSALLGLGFLARRKK